jgi:Zn-dependent M28 family amino/carboxypeptidase
LSALRRAIPAALSEEVLVRKSLVSAVTLTTAVAIALTAAPAGAIDEINTERLRNAVTVGGILSHERVFQRIANNNGGTRASGTPGYTASANYVAGVLEDAGYDVTRQPFDFAFFQEFGSAFDRVSPNPRTFLDQTDYDVMDYSGSGNVTGTVQAVDVVIPIGSAPPNTSTSGCEDSDFANFTAGNIALIQRGTCPFGDKAVNAEQAGAVGVIIFNEGQPGRDTLLLGTLGGPVVDIPVIGVSYALGVDLNAPTTVVHIFTSTESEIRQTENILADSPTGNPDRTVVVGAHLDSVLEGPGINDNGSGSSTILEIAQEMSELGIRNRQQVRFAFWGAEENNLLGSEHYVANLTDAELGQIVANLNFDMVGSPNYVRFVYDGDGSDTPAAGPPGSAEIEDIFTSYFASQGLASEPTAFDGRSDYGPFIAVGIPAGGLFTGAEGVKTPAQAAIYGGMAGEPYDPCYHQACDDINNLSTQALFEMGDAAAHAVMTLARTRTGFFPDGSLRAQKAPDLSFERKGGVLVR